VTQFHASTKAADAPDIEGGMYDALFDRAEGKLVKGGQYTRDTVKGDPKLEWFFTLLDDDGAVIRNEDDDSERFGEAIQVSKLTGVGFNIASKTTPSEVLMLKALLSADEFAAFENGEGTPDDEKDVAEGGLLGRVAQGEVFVKENGWPGLGNVTALPKRRRAK
jgi:hypothetical protein